MEEFQNGSLLLERKPCRNEAALLKETWQTGQMKGANSSYSPIPYNDQLETHGIGKATLALIVKFRGHTCHISTLGSLMLLPASGISMSFLHLNAIIRFFHTGPVVLPFISHFSVNSTRPFWELDTVAFLILWGLRILLRAGQERVGLCWEVGWASAWCFIWRGPHIWLHINSASWTCIVGATVRWIWRLGTRICLFCWRSKSRQL